MTGTFASLSMVASLIRFKSRDEDRSVPPVVAGGSPMLRTRPLPQAVLTVCLILHPSSFLLIHFASDKRVRTSFRLRLFDRGCARTRLKVLNHALKFSENF